jgi:phenylacetate-CoA ligase
MRVWLKDLFVRSMPAPAVERARRIANLIPGRFRYGKAYKIALGLLLDSQEWDESRFLKYQQDKLEMLISHCYCHIPHYRRTFDELGIAIRDIQSIEDLKKLPLLDKEQVRRSGRKLLAENVSFYQRGRATTSGSTGAPLTLYLDETARAFERALSFFHLLWLGWSPSDRVAYISPNPGSGPTISRPVISASHELRLTFTAMDEERLSAAVKLLEGFRPDIISAWPSSLYLLARWMSRKGKRLQSPRFLVTSSENLYPHVRDFMEEFYQARVIDFYGQEESVAFAMQCDNSGPYHLRMLASIPELLPAYDDLYEVVGTSLHNSAMPLLRYRTGDLVRRNHTACRCGRPFADIKSVDGRESDFIVTPERKIVSPLILNHCFHGLEELRESQIIQEDANTLRVVVVPWGSVSEDTSNALLKSLRKTLESDAMRIILEPRDELPEGTGCKTPFIVSRLKLRESLASPS